MEMTIPRFIQSRTSWVCRDLRVKIPMEGSMVAQHQWTLEQKLEVVLLPLKGEISVAEPSLRHGVTEATCYEWRSCFLEDGKSGPFEMRLASLPYGTPEMFPRRLHKPAVIV